MYAYIHGIVSFLARSIGYRVIKSHRIPRSYGNLLDFAIPALRANYKPINFLQVGANDGVLNDPVMNHLLLGGFRGVRLEPIPEICEMLKKNNAKLEDIEILEMAVSDHEGVVNLYVPWTGDPTCTTHQNASLKKTQLRSKNYEKSRTSVVSVRCTTIARIVDEYLDNKWHLVSIDAEGHDYQILKRCFKDEIEPDGIFFEIVHLERNEKVEYREELADRGYVFVEDYKDCLAIKSQLLV